MPDADPKLRLDEDGHVIIDGPTPTELRIQAIQNCELCDDEGYRGSAVCDHIDRTDTAARGIAQIRAQMGWNSTPPPNHP